MRNLLFILLIGSLFVGCNAERQLKLLEKHHPEFFDKGYDSVRIVTHTDTIHDTIPLPSVELWFDTTGVVPIGLKYHHEEKKGRLTSTVDIKDGHLTAICKEDSMQMIINSLRKSIIESHYKKEVIVKEVKKVPWWAYVAVFCAIVLLIAYAATIFIYELGKK